MTEEFDYDDTEVDPDDFEIDDARAEIAQLARTEGLRVAYATALAIAGDKQAPAAVRVAASRTLLEIAGMLSPRDRAAIEAAAKGPSEMTAEELSAAIDRLERRRVAGNAPRKDAAAASRRAKSDSVFD